MKRKVRIGRIVTTNTEREGYYSGYPRGNPRFSFSPGMVGKVSHDDVAAVCQRKGFPDWFYLVDFHSPITGKVERVNIYKHEIVAPRLRRLSARFQPARLTA